MYRGSSHEPKLWVSEDRSQTTEDGWSPGDASRWSRLRTWKSFGGRISVVAGDPSDQLAMAVDRTACAGRSDAACEQVHLCECCRRIWSSEALEGGVQRFLQMAIGSSDEMRDWVRDALDLGYVDEAAWQRWRDEYRVITHMLQVLAARSWGCRSSVVCLLSSAR